MTVAVSVIVETIGALPPSGEIAVSLGADAVSVIVRVTMFVTEMVEVVVEALQDPLPSSCGEATRFSIDPAVARVAMYAKAAMADVENLILDERNGIGVVF